MEGVSKTPKTYYRTFGHVQSRTFEGGPHLVDGFRREIREARVYQRSEDPHQGVHARFRYENRSYGTANNRPQDIQHGPHCSDGTQVFFDGSVDEGLCIELRITSVDSLSESDCMIILEN